VREGGDGSGPGRTPAKELQHAMREWWKGSFRDRVNDGMSIFSRTYEDTERPQGSQDLPSQKGVDEIR